MRIIIHNFHHSFHHRGRRGHRGYSGGNIFTHSSDTDCLSVFWKKCRKFFSLPSFPFLPSLSFLSSVSSASSVVKIVMKTVMNLLLCLLLLSFDNSYNQIPDENVCRHLTPGNRVLYKVNVPVDGWDTTPYCNANNVCRTSVPHLPPLLFRKPLLPVEPHAPDRKRLHEYS